MEVGEVVVEAETVEVIDQGAAVTHVAGRSPPSVVPAVAPGVDEERTRDGQAESARAQRSREGSARAGARSGGGERHKPAPIPAPGQLTDTTPDVMTIHTTDAYFLYAGSGGALEFKEPPIVCGQMAASALSMIRRRSLQDNPYADWVLLRFYEALATIRAGLERSLRERSTQIEKLQRKGLAVNVLASREPLQVQVSFDSAYGYAIAETIVEFDGYVRTVKTLVLKDRLSGDAGHDAIRAIGRPLRRLFDQVLAWDRTLRRDDLRGLSRDDFLPQADKAALARVAVASRKIGPLPQEVLTRAIVPRHGRRVFEHTLRDEGSHGHGAGTMVACAPVDGPRSQ